MDDDDDDDNSSLTDPDSDSEYNFNSNDERENDSDDDDYFDSDDEIGSDRGRDNSGQIIIVIVRIIFQLRLTIFTPAKKVAVPTYNITIISKAIAFLVLEMTSP